MIFTYCHHRNHHIMRREVEIVPRQRLTHPASLSLDQGASAHGHQHRTTSTPLIFLEDITIILLLMLTISYYIWRVQSSQIPLLLGCFLLGTLKNTSFWQKLLPTDTFWFVAVPQPTSFQINSSFCLPTLNCFLSSLPLATSYFRFLHPWQPPGNMATWQPPGFCQD